MQIRLKSPVVPTKRCIQNTRLRKILLKVVSFRLIFRHMELPVGLAYALTFENNWRENLSVGYIFVED